MKQTNGMNNYEYVFMDLDGTLLDFYQCEVAALKKTFAVHGVRFDEKILKRYLLINEDLWKQHEENKINQEDLLQYRFELLFQFEKIDHPATQFSEDYLWNLSSEAYLEPDSIMILNYLYKKYDLYIVTNGDITTQLNRINKADILHFFQDVFVSSEIGYHKPQADFFNICCQRAGINNENRKKIILIGDSLSSDILGGRDAGIDTCWYNRSKKTNKTEIIPTYEIDSLNQLKEFL